MSLEKEVMLVYGSNLDIYNIKVKKFIQAISVSIGSGRTDYFTSARDNTKAQEKLKNKLIQKALEVGANGVVDVKSCGELGSSLGGNAVTLEGKGFEEFDKERKILKVERQEREKKELELNNDNSVMKWGIGFFVVALLSIVLIYFASK